MPKKTPPHATPPMRTSPATPAALLTQYRNPLARPAIPSVAKASSPPLTPPDRDLSMLTGIVSQRAQFFSQPAPISQTAPTPRDDRTQRPGSAHRGRRTSKATASLDTMATEEFSLESPLHAQQGTPPLGNGSTQRPGSTQRDRRASGVTALPSASSTGEFSFNSPLTPGRRGKPLYQAGMRRRPSVVSTRSPLHSDATHETTVGTDYSLAARGARPPIDVGESLASRLERYKAAARGGAAQDGSRPEIGKLPWKGRPLAPSAATRALNHERPNRLADRCADILARLTQEQEAYRGGCTGEDLKSLLTDASIANQQLVAALSHHQQKPGNSNLAALGQALTNLVGVFAVISGNVDPAAQSDYLDRLIKGALQGQTSIQQQQGFITAVIYALALTQSILDHGQLEQRESQTLDKSLEVIRGYIGHGLLPIPSSYDFNAAAIEAGDLDAIPVASPTLEPIEITLALQRNTPEVLDQKTNVALRSVLAMIDGLAVPMSPTTTALIEMKGLKDSGIRLMEDGVAIPYYVAGTTLADSKIIFPQETMAELIAFSEDGHASEYIQKTADAAKVSSHLANAYEKYAHDVVKHYQQHKKLAATDLVVDHSAVLKMAEVLASLPGFGPHQAKIINAAQRMRDTAELLGAIADSTGEPGPHGETPELPATLLSHKLRRTRYKFPKPKYSTPETKKDLVGTEDVTLEMPDSMSDNQPQQRADAAAPTPSLCATATLLGLGIVSWWGFIGAVGYGIYRLATMGYHTQPPCLGSNGISTMTVPISLYPSAYTSVAYHSPQYYGRSIDTCRSALTASFLSSDFTTAPLEIYGTNMTIDELFSQQPSTAFLFNDTHSDTTNCIHLLHQLGNATNIINTVDGGQTVVFNNLTPDQVATLIESLHFLVQPGANVTELRLNLAISADGNTFLQQAVFIETTPTTGPMTSGSHSGSTTHTATTTMSAVTHTATGAITTSVTTPTPRPGSSSSQVVTLTPTISSGVPTGTITAGLSATGSSTPSQVITFSSGSATISATGTSSLLITPSMTSSAINTTTFSTTSSGTYTLTTTPTETQEATVSSTASSSGSMSETVSITTTNSATQSQTMTQIVTQTNTATGSMSQSISQTVTQSGIQTSSQTTTVTASQSATASQSVSFGWSHSQSPSLTLTPTPAPTPSMSGTHSGSGTSSSSLTPSITATLSQNGTALASVSMTGSMTASVTTSPSQTGSGSLTPSPSLTLSPTGTPSGSGTYTTSSTGTRTLTNSGSITQTATISRSSTGSSSASPTQTETVTETTTNSATQTKTITQITTQTNTATGSITQSVTQTITCSGTQTSSQTTTVTTIATPSPTGSASQSTSRTQSQSPTLTLTPTPSPTPSTSGTRSGSSTLSTSPTPSITATLSQNGTPLASASITGSMTASVSKTSSQTGSSSFTQSPSLTFSPTGTGTASFTPSGSGTVSLTNSVSQTMSGTLTASSSATVTPTLTLSTTPTGSRTPSVTASVTSTPSTSITATATGTPSPTMSITVSATKSGTGTPTATISPSSTATTTPSGTGSLTVTPSQTHSVTITMTPSATGTPSISVTVTETATGSVTHTMSLTSSQTQTETLTGSITVTPSGTASFTPTPSQSTSATPTTTPSATGTALFALTPAGATSLTCVGNPCTLLPRTGGGTVRSNYFPITNLTVALTPGSYTIASSTGWSVSNDVFTPFSNQFPIPDQATLDILLARIQLASNHGGQAIVTATSSRGNSSLSFPVIGSRLLLESDASSDHSRLAPPPSAHTFLRGADSKGTPENQQGAWPR